MIAVRWPLGLGGLALGFGCAGLFPNPDVRTPVDVDAPEDPVVANPVAGTEQTALIETVRQLYRAYETETTPMAQVWLPAASADLARQWATATAQAKDACGIPAIYGSDLIVDAQDYFLTEVEVVDVKVAGGSGKATVRFRNFDAPGTVGYSLIAEDGVWRIDDIHPGGFGADAQARRDSLRQRIFATVVAGDGC